MSLNRQTGWGITDKFECTIKFLKANSHWLVVFLLKHTFGIEPHASQANLRVMEIRRRLI